MPEHPKLLFDENIGVSVARHFSNTGYDVVSVVLESALRGVSDLRILEYAVSENRIVVTLDKDFAELVFRSGHSHAGVILMRLTVISPAHICMILDKVLGEISHIPQGKFLVVNETSVRIR
jgi:predicted nuclease of predicted toxin-antitoxin system